MWVVNWIVGGMLMGPVVEAFTSWVEDRRLLNTRPSWIGQGGWMRLIIMFFILAYGAPAIDGLQLWAG
jgi:hypothetical protein